MILHGRIVDQVVDRDVTATFRKEIVVTGGPVPLAMVRKRAVVGTPAESGVAVAEAARLAGTPAQTRAPVLLIHGFGQNRYAWHLPARSFANHLACEGYDVFNLDLRGHGRSRKLGARKCRGIEDYVREDVPTAIDEVRSLSEGRPVWLIGHSLGGLLAYATAPSMKGAVAGVVSIGSPYHFTRGSLTLGALALFFRAIHVAPLPLPNASLPLGPVSLTMRSLWRFAESPFYPLPVRGWHVGSCEPHILEQHLRLAFDRAALAETVDLFDWASQKRFGGKELDYVERFERMDLPLFVIAGSNDDLAPPASVRPAFLRSRASDKTYRALPLGHIDLLVGRDAPATTWSLVTSWLHKRAGTAAVRVA